VLGFGPRLEVHAPLERCTLRLFAFRLPGWRALRVKGVRLSVPAGDRVSSRWRGRDNDRSNLHYTQVLPPRQRGKPTAIRAFARCLGSSRHLFSPAAAEASRESSYSRWLSSLARRKDLCVVEVRASCGYTSFREMPRQQPASLLSLPDELLARIIFNCGEAACTQSLRSASA
jgi:hypothetical protein